ncbi:oligosaccharide flippase family protein [Alicyclobacillus curvatus]|nr:oligosaccharide flippase family protein [Alicyclobacillus curvatus]
MKRPGVLAMYLEFRRNMFGTWHIRTQDGVLKGIRITLTNSIAVKAIDFVTLWIIVRALSKVQYGNYAFIVSLFAIISALQDMGINNSYIKFFNTEPVRIRYMINFVSWKLISSIVINVVSVAVFFISTSIVKVDISFVLIMSIGAVFYTLYEFVDTHLQSTQQFRERAIYVGANYLVRLLFIVIFIVLFKSRDIRTVLYLYFGSTSIVGTVIISAWVVRHRSSVVETLSDVRTVFYPLYMWKRFYRYSLWIFISTIATVLISRIDSLMIYNMQGASQNADYALGVQVTGIVALLTQSITTVLRPYLFSGDRWHNIRSYIRTVSKLTLPIVVLLLGSTFISGPLLIIFFGHRYDLTVPIVNILICTFALDLFGNQLNLLFYHYEKHYFLTITNYIQLILDVIMNLVLIPHYGIVAAAYNHLLIRIVGYILQWTYLGKLSRIMAETVD